LVVAPNADPNPDANSGAEGAPGHADSKSDAIIAAA
jgi:hypothetical protein